MTVPGNFRKGACRARCGNCIPPSLGNAFNVIWVIQSAREKYSASPAGQIASQLFASHRARDGSRVVTNARWDAVAAAPASPRAPAPLAYCGPPCTFLSGLPSSASASAFSNFLMSSGDRCGRSTLIVSFSSFAVSANGGW